MAKLTPWFPASVKPVRDGFYEVRDNVPWHRNSLKGKPIRLWRDGRWWGGWIWLEPSIFGTRQTHEWRGLASPPKEQSNG